MDRLIRQAGSLSSSGLSSSPSLSPSPAISCIRRSRPTSPTNPATRCHSQHKSCSTSIRFVSHPRLRRKSAQETHTVCPQFEVTTPHIIYACLGGFVVLVRPLSLPCPLYSPSHTWHQFGMFSFFIREKVCVICSLELRKKLKNSTALYWRGHMGIPLRSCHWCV